MKIIHTADLHLDSAMMANLDNDRARERRNEILLNFARLCDNAERLSVSAILIAGDLFDKKSVSAKAAKVVLNEIEKHKDIAFYYLRGNHDKDSFINYIKENGDIPSNLFMFEDKWTKYTLSESGAKKICLYGAEFDKDNSSSIFYTLDMNTEDINIVMLHGQESEYEGKDDAEIIPIGNLKGRGIDYLALGHIHAYKVKELDSRGVYCYPGCLEGRGFDECGEHGFMLLDINEETGKVEYEFIDFACRKLHIVDVDISGLDNSSSIIDKVREELLIKDYDKNDLIKISLQGSVDEYAEIDESLIAKSFSEDYFFVKVKNESKVFVDYMKYAQDESLKGFFIRALQEDDTLNDELKGEVVKMGLGALAGEEIIQ